MFIIYTMVVWATFVLLHTHSCSAPTLLPGVQQWRSDTFSLLKKMPISATAKWAVVDAGCWQTLHQLKPQPHAHMFPKKHICPNSHSQESGCNVPQCHCFGRRAIPRFVSIILHNQRRNQYLCHNFTTKLFWEDAHADILA